MQRTRKPQFSVAVHPELLGRLREQAAEDGAGPSTRARVLLELWDEDESIQAMVQARLRAERLRGARDEQEQEAGQ